MDSAQQVSKLTCQNIESRLFEYALRDLNQNLVVLRCEALGYEADVLTLSNTAYLTEFEIKISRADFLADSKKRKWLTYLDEDLKSSKRHNGFPYTPNYVYYRYPKDLVTLDEIPEFAGAIDIHVRSNGFTQIRILKRAPRMSKSKCTPKLMRKMVRSLTFKTLNLLKKLY